MAISNWFSRIIGKAPEVVVESPRPITIMEDDSCSNAYGQPNRPDSLDTFSGQDKLKVNVERDIRAARALGLAFGHTLITGPSGTGKTTLGYIIANEMRVNCTIINASQITNTTDFNNSVVACMYDDGLAALDNPASSRPSPKKKNILIIDEAHLLPKKVQTDAYHLLEDHVFNHTYKDLVIQFNSQLRETGRGPGQFFTLICITTHTSRLLEAFRNRLKNQYVLDRYSDEYIAELLVSQAKVWDLELSDEVAVLIAQRSNGIPREALNHRLRPIRDEIVGYGLSPIITKELVEKVMRALQVDHYGFTSEHRQVLRAVDEGMSSLDSLMITLGIDDVDTIKLVYEAELRRQGLLAVKPGKGRYLTPAGQKYLASVENWS